MTTPAPPPPKQQPQQRQQSDGRRRPRWPGAKVLSLALVVYLVIAVVVWWHVWSSHPSSVTTCACDDPSLFVWFLEWPAFALAHGHNPFYSTALFHPTGVNLLSNTGVLALGVPLAPVTWLFGPVATLNVASTLAVSYTHLDVYKRQERGRIRRVWRCPSR